MEKSIKMFYLSPILSHQVTSTGVVVSGKWGLCQDERTIIYDGSGAGSFCPMPFLYNRQYFDTCTRKSSVQSTGFENYFWCPNPGLFFTTEKLDLKKFTSVYCLIQSCHTENTVRAAQLSFNKQIFIYDRKFKIYRTFLVLFISLSLYVTIPILPNYRFFIP